MKLEQLKDLIRIHDEIELVCKALDSHIDDFYIGFNGEHSLIEHYLGGWCDSKRRAQLFSDFQRWLIARAYDIRQQLKNVGIEVD